MATFTRQIKSVTKLINKYGKECVWTQTPIVTPDITKPWIKESGIPTTYNPKICFFTLANSQIFFKYNKDQESVSGEFTGLMAKQVFTPQINDTVSVNGENIVIVDIDPLRPNWDDIYYEILFRRGA